MSLTPEQARELIDSIGSARAEGGLACDECLAELAEFVETRLKGEPFTVIQRRVDEHLAQCVDCREEYEALRRAVETLDEPG